MGRSQLWLCLMLLAALAISPSVYARRGRAKTRSRSRMQIGLPVTGKYRDPESDQYYNHHGVSPGRGWPWSSLQLREPSGAERGHGGAEAEADCPARGQEYLDEK